jgi:uncharacterized protein
MVSPYTDRQIGGILERTKTIAMVGVSPNWQRPSNFVMKFLMTKGYRVIPVNPNALGMLLLGERVYPSLSHVPGPFQMVDIFRDSNQVDRIVDEALMLAPYMGIETIWMQLGVINDDAAATCRDAGLEVIMDRCPKIEHIRLNK